MKKPKLSQELYVQGKSVTDIAIALGISRATVYYQKNKDKQRGICWDKQRLLKLTDNQDIEQKEQLFIARLIASFDQTVKSLEQSEPEKQIEILAKYATLYYKFKRQKENPQINKAEIAKNSLKKLSELALERQAKTVIDFLAIHADEIVNRVMKEL